MCTEIACLRRCKVPLIAIVWLLDKMQSHTDCIFSTVCVQMSPQCACLNRVIVTLVAFVWLFSTVCFQKKSDRHVAFIAHPAIIIPPHLPSVGCICLTFLHCALSNVFSNGLHENMHSCIGSIGLILWYCWSSRFSCLNPSNQCQNCQESVPLPCSVVRYPNDCLKLRQIFHCKTSIIKAFTVFNLNFHFFKQACKPRSFASWKLCPLHWLREALQQKTVKKRVNRDKCVFATKHRMFGILAIIEILHYHGLPIPDPTH